MAHRLLSVNHVVGIVAKAIADSRSSLCDQDILFPLFRNKLGALFIDTQPTIRLFWLAQTMCSCWICYVYLGTRGFIAISTIH